MNTKLNIIFENGVALSRSEIFKIDGKIYFDVLYENCSGEVVDIRKLRVDDYELLPEVVGEFEIYKVDGKKFLRFGDIMNILELRGAMRSHFEKF